MVFFLIDIILAIVICSGTLFLFLRRKPNSFRAYLLLGWTLQVLLSLPAGIWQAIMSWPHISLSGFGKRLLIPFIGWPINAGGYSIRWVFETTVEPLEFLVGHRSSIVLSNMQYYSFLLFVQGSILAAIFAWRYKKKQTFKDPLILCMTVLFLLNSFVNVKWFWAGT